MEKLVKLVLMANSLTIILSPWVFALMVMFGKIKTSYDLFIFIGLIALSEFERRK